MITDESRYQWPEATNTNPPPIEIRRDSVTPVETIPTGGVIPGFINTASGPLRASSVIPNRKPHLRRTSSFSDEDNTSVAAGGERL